MQGTQTVSLDTQKPIVYESLIVVFAHSHCWPALFSGPISAPFPIPYLFEQEDE